MDSSQFDEEEFDRVYDTYGKMVYRIAFLRLKSAEDAEDTVQDVFVKYMTRNVGFDSEEHRKAWFIRAAVDLCKDLKKGFWHTRVLKISDLSVLDIAVESDLESECLLDIIRLPAKQNTVLYLYYYEGYSIKQIAEMLGQKERSVSSTLSRARRSLRNRMEQQDGGEYI